MNVLWIAMVAAVPMGCAANSRVEGMDVDAYLEIVDRAALESAFQGIPDGEGPDTILALTRYDEAGRRQGIFISPETLPEERINDLTMRIGAAVPVEIAPTEQGRTIFFRLVPGEPTVLPPPATARPPELNNVQHIRGLLLELYGDFPQLARRSALVNVEIDATGTVVDWSLVRSSGDTEADLYFVAIAREARFTPATVGDYPVRVWAQLPLSVTEASRNFGPPETPG